MREKDVRTLVRLLRKVEDDDNRPVSVRKRAAMLIVDVTRKDAPERPDRGVPITGPKFDYGD